MEYGEKKVIAKWMLDEAMSLLARAAMYIDDPKKCEDARQLSRDTFALRRRVDEEQEHIGYVEV